MKKFEIAAAGVILMIMGILFFVLKSTTEARIAMIGLIGIVAMLLTKKIIPKDVTDIFIRDNHNTRALSLEEKERLLEILSEERGFLSIKKDYVRDDRVIVIDSKKKTIELVYCKDDNGEDLILFEDGRYSFRMTKKSKAVYKQILGIE